MKKYLSIAMVGALALGCENGLNTAPTGDVLTEEELAAVSNHVIGVAMDAGLGEAQPPVQQSAAYYGAPVNFDLAIDRTVECYEGGTMNLDGSMAGSFDSEAGTGSIELNFTQTASACGVPTEEHGVFVIDGNPNLVLDGSMAWGAEGPTGTSVFTYRGGFSWSNGDRSGTCGIDVELSWSADAASYSGSVCGTDVSVSVEAG